MDAFEFLQGFRGPVSIVEGVGKTPHMRVHLSDARPVIDDEEVAFYSGGEASIHLSRSVIGDTAEEVWTEYGYTYHIIACGGFDLLLLRA